MAYDDSLSRRIDPATAAAFHPDHLERYRFAAERARGLRVLDVGCATGYGSAILAEEASPVTAIDVFEDNLHYARAAFKRPNLTFRRHDIISDVPLNAAPFDAVVCFEVTEHVERPVEMLKAMARAHPLLLDAERSRGGSARRRSQRSDPSASTVPPRSWQCSARPASSARSSVDSGTGPKP